MSNPAAQNPRCRFCEAPLRHTFVDLGPSPLCQRHVTPAEARGMEPFYPLHAYVCAECFLVQLAHDIPPGQIFSSDYAYFSSYSDSWLQHAATYAERMIERLHLTPRNRVVEIASNDGYLLQYFARRGIPVLGVEPTANTAQAAIAKGIPTVVRFFGVQTARELVAEYGQADLLIGNNVLAHVPDLNDFVAGIKLTLAPRGVLTMEFPHLQRLMEENQFDTIYHEHFSYFSFTTVEKVFAKHGITLFDVEELPTHGGSLRIFGRHSGSLAPVLGGEGGGEGANVKHASFHNSPKNPSPLPSPLGTGERGQEAVANLRERERAAGFTDLRHYAYFGERVKETKRKLLDFLIQAKRAGKSIAGYGAPGKGNTLLNYCGIRTDFLDYTVDRSPHKQGNFLPGTRIPILHPDKVRETRPDYLLILPWNLRDEIMHQMAYIRDWGGKFVVPIPEARVYE